MFRLNKQVVAFIGGGVTVGGFMYLKSEFVLLFPQYKDHNDTKLAFWRYFLTRNELYLIRQKVPSAYNTTIDDMIKYVKQKDAEVETPPATPEEHRAILEEKQAACAGKLDENGEPKNKEIYEKELVESPEAKKQITTNYLWSIIFGSPK